MRTPVCLWTLVAGALAALPALADGELLAGASAVRITPEVGEDRAPVYLAGFGQDRTAESVHDDIWARALVLSSAGERYAFVALDLIGYGGHRIEAATAQVEKEVGIPATHVVVSSTHTHHGPDAIGIWGPRPTRSGIDPAFLDRVDGAILESVRQAAAALVPVRLRAGEVDVPEVLRDSREPEVMDPVLRTLHFEKAGGETVATVFVYAMHPEVLWSRNRVLTSDYPHFVRARAEGALGGTAIFFPGAVGGMQTPKVPEHDFGNAEWVGNTLADRGVGSLQGAEWLVDPEVRFVTRRVSFPLENLMFRVAIGMGVIPGGKHLEYSERGLARLFETPRVPSRLAAISIGPIRIATLPGELFPELADPIRAHMRTGPKILLGLAGNELGYILPREQWNPLDYEESMSLGPSTGPILVDALGEMLDELERGVDGEK